MPVLNQEILNFLIPVIAVILSFFFSTRLLHAYVQYVNIVAAKYQIAPSKAVVGVDQPIKALSMHIQKPYVKNCLMSHTCIFFFNQTPSCICSMCLYCVGKVSNAPLKDVVGVDRPMKAPSMHIQKPYKGKIV